MTMNDFENQLDEIRIELFERTKSMKRGYCYRNQYEWQKDLKKSET